LNNLALFDFDGTITNSDSLLGFLKYFAGKKNYYMIKYIKCFHYYLSYYFGLIGYEKLKRKMIYYIIKKEKVGELNIIAKQYYEKFIRNDVKVTALKALNKHKKKGDKVVVVSASLEILLQFFCKDHGLDLIANNLVIRDGIYLGEIEGRDCNGIEKVKRIKANYNLSNYKNIYAYGDSKFDLPMLEIANFSNYKTFN